ncbi:unnamed protein product [Candidula unifasciata]|uniref:Histone deacetylase complex subunit SAP130 C-terminal domain-containing protein n=1 Tax=Candidula unifasciata TaxID=100452 RepID=A0A8S4A1T1_9EUPU|nr:unnamed protein product [Candidula unifasciata]
MSKNKSRGVADRKGEGSTGSESIAPRMITSQATTSCLQNLRQNPALTTGHTFIVQSHHEMKNFSKSARPIAPAPPTQTVQNLAARNVQSSQANIPSIISPALATGNNDNLVSLNFVTTTASGGLGTISHNPNAVPVTLHQTNNVFQLGSSTTAGNLSVVQQGITMLRGSNSAGQQAQSHIQAFAHSFPQVPRGTPSPAVPKSAGVLRQGPSPALQIPAGLNTLPLPIARAPLLQSIKTTTTQATRPQSPAVGGLPAPQTQPQDLSRTNFSMHGSVIPGGIAPLSMHVTLNRMDNSSVNQDSSILQSRTVTAQVQKDAPASIQQRISVSLSSDSNLHSRLTPELARSTLPFSGSAKVTHPSFVPQPKVVSAQQGASIKTVNLAVTTPVMINSINPTLTTATTTVASTTPIPIAKVTPQRQFPMGSIPSSPAALPHVSSSLSAVSVTVSHTSMTTTSLPSSTSLAGTLSANISDTGPLRHEQGGISSTQSSTGGILISDFPNRPPGSIITMTTLPSSIQGNNSPLVVSQGESRSTNQNQQQFDVKPGDSMWLQHYVLTQAPLVPQPAQIVRPGANTFAFLPSQGKILAQTPNLAATQLAAMSVASTSNVRFNSGPVMMVEQLRQHHQQHPVQSPFSAGTTTVGGISDKAANLLSRSTMASSIYTTSASVQSHIPGAGGGVGSNAVTGGLSAVPVSNPSSSPRPSILRKRTSETAGIVIRKPNFNLNQENRCHSPPRVDTNITSVCSPKISIKNFSPVSENSQSSTDTALSSNDATTPTHNHHDKGKGDGEDCLQHSPVSLCVVNNIPASPAVSHAESVSEASPRKRARKQLLHVSEELKDNTSSSEEELEKNAHRHREDSVKEQNHLDKEIRGEYTDEEGVRWVLNKPKPTYVLLQPDFINSKTKNNHFIRYSDVKPKEERRPTVNELSNQRSIMQKVNGWKLYFSASQLEELANIQRCQLIQSQLSEAMAAMIRTLEHKPRIQEIVNKHMSKRPIKKKERT